MGTVTRGDMPVYSFHFDRFVLDPQNRLLKRDDVPLELNPRYFDALTLLVRENGTLISKERFLDEVWAGVPVTDEALTQCIKTLRRLLGDDANQPRFIETVVKHGYRFIGAVDRDLPQNATSLPNDSAPFRLGRIWHRGLAGTVGGGTAGLICGAVYGFVAAYAPGAEGGSVSTLVVIVGLTFAMALLGAAGVSFGAAIGRAFSNSTSVWIVVGAASGGFLIGALINLLGTDAIALLFGHPPGHITGAPEGLCVGASVGLSLWGDAHLKARGIARFRLTIAAAAGAAGGLLATGLGGRLMGGSLLSLATQFPASHLRLDEIGRLAGERNFGPISQTAATTFESALFCICVVMAMTRSAGTRKGR